MQTILLDMIDHHDEGIVEGTVYPGMNVMRKPADPSLLVAGAGQEGGTLPMIVKEDGNNGRTVIDALIDERILYCIPNPGDPICVLLKDGESISKGDLLKPDDTGLFIKTTTNPAFFRAEQAANPIGANELVTVRAVDVCYAFLPIQISGLLAWWDFSDEDVVTTVGGFDTGISGMLDKSGNGFHMAQSTGVKQPLYKEAIQNGKNIARFDGSDDFLTAGSVAGLDDYDDMHVYAVVQRTPAPLQNAVMIAVQNYVQAGSLSGYGFDINSNNLRWFAAESASAWKIVNTAAIAFPEDEWWILEISKDDLEVELKKNDVLVKSQTLGGAELYYAGANRETRMGAGKNAVGSLSHWKGDIGELFIFDGKLSSGDDADMKSYLSNSWGITI